LAIEWIGDKPNAITSIDFDLTELKPLGDKKFSIETPKWLPVKIKSAIRINCISKNSNIEVLLFDTRPKKLLKSEIEKLEDLQGVLKLLFDANTLQNKHRANFDLKGIIEAVPDNIFIMDKCGNVVDFKVGELDAKVLGLPENLGKPIENILPPSIAFTVRDKLKQTLESGKMQEYEFETNDIRGNLIRHSRMVPFGEEQVLVINQDITSQKLSGQRIRETEERYRTLVDNSPLGILTVSKNFEIVDANQAMADILGVDSPELIKGLQVDGENNVLPSFVKTEIVKCFKSGCNMSVETVINKKNDTELSVFVYLIIVHDQEGNVFQTHVIFEDISQQKDFEKELKLSKELAEQANMAKSEFLANMSHEVRTPLNALLGFLQLLSKEKLSTKQLKYLDAIQSAGQAINSITSEILDISKIEKGHIRILSEPASLRKIIDDAVTIIAHRITSNRNKIDIDIQNDLFPSHFIDADKLRQVIINLLDNASKFTKNGLIMIKIDSAQTENIDNVSIFVKDTGIGIPKDMRERVFEPFTQIDSSATKRQGGSGLGLSIVKGIVTAMNGSISILETKEAGTTFVIKLPFERCLKNNKDNVNNIRPMMLLISEHGSKEFIQIVLANLGFEFLNIDETSADIANLDLFISDYSTESIKTIIQSNTDMKVIQIGEKNVSTNWIGIEKESLQNTFLSALFKFYQEDSSIATVLLCDAKVLVVEDNSLNLMLISEILEKLGCLSRVCTSSIEAVELVKSEQFDVCLMDVQMPDLSGLDATLQIRHFEEISGSSKRLPIIALTAFATTDDKERCLTAGMDAYIAKPIKIDELVLKMASVIRDSRIGTPRALLDELSERMLIEKSKLKEILKTYLDMSLSNIIVMKKQIEEQKFNEAYKLAHQIKGMAYQDVLLRSVVDLEKALINQESEKAKRNLEEVNFHLQSLQDEVCGK